VSEPQRRVSIEGLAADALQAEWTSDSEWLVFEAAGAFGQKALYRVPRDGGSAELIHRFSSDQVHSGIAVSPDDRWVAFIALDGSGFYQVFRVPLAGGAPEAITVDPSHKTQPAYSPTGDRIAFTVWRYDVHFWMIEP
jgi:Tol biopolymer transport system component